MTPEAVTIPVIWAEAVTSDGRFLWRSEKRNHAPWFAVKRPRDDWLIVTRPCVLVQRTTAKEQPRRLIAAELLATFIHEHKGVTVENHLNMVRGIERPSVPPATIAALMNSVAVDAAFRCLNGSVAVSAFELEELPLPAPIAMGKLASLVATDASPAKMGQPRSRRLTVGTMLPLPLEVPKIHRRLFQIFPEGTPQRNYCTREMAARTVFVMLYIGAVEGTGMWPAPKHVYRMGIGQSARRSDQDRQAYITAVERRGSELPVDRWFQDNTREPIRDETLRDGLVGSARS